MPSASSVRPSSSPEQSIPWLVTPAIVVTSMRRSPGSTAPGSATGTRWPDRDVRRAADDRELGLAIPDADAGQRELRRAGMRSDLQQLAHDDALPVGADALDRADLHAQERQALRELLWREVDGDELAQPGERHAHR